MWNLKTNTRRPREQKETQQTFFCIIFWAQPYFYWTMTLRYIVVLLYYAPATASDCIGINDW